MASLALAALALPACAELRVQAACERICECELIPGASIEECTNLCVSELTPSEGEESPISDECYECIISAECSTIENDCDDLCGGTDDTAEPQPGEPQ